jgi:hypothetical protein
VEAAVSVAMGPTVQAHCLTCMGYAIPSRSGPAVSSVGEVLRARLLD